MAYLLLAVLWIGWCVIHSGMISLTTTGFLKRRLGTGYRFYRLFFNIFAVATVMPLFACTESLQGPALFRWHGLMTGVQVLLLALSGLLFLGGTWHYDLLQFLGVRQIATGSFHHALSDTGKLNTDGILNITRHPWYLGGILFVWASCERMDIATLVMNVILTAHLIVGAILEER
jgi:protein-S-isoprenylcysteine O-methyltransferase Ste14